MDDILTPGPFKYDGVVREASYLQRQILAAWDVQLGVVKPGGPAPDAEDAARLEHAALQVAVTHAKNVLRSLAVRRDALADVLILQERPRVDAAYRERDERTTRITPREQERAQQLLREAEGAQDADDGA